MKKHLPNSLRALFLSLAVLLSLPMLAVTVEIDGIMYDLNAEAKQATVIRKSSGEYSGKVVIPESVEHESTAYSVESIGSYAFCEYSGLTSVTIPNSVTSIGYAAFSYCSGLTSVSIGNSVTSIGDYAFESCSGLTSVIIPNSVTSIGSAAFFCCSGLTSVTIGNSVESIGESTFYGCSGLTSVTIGNSVTSIGNQAFGGCSGLTSVTIPNSVMSIGNAAFYNCSGLTSVTIPNSVTSIRGEAFRDCSKLIDVYCYAENVPSTESSAFVYSPIDNATLHVPAGSVDSYTATAPWNDFGSIVALPPFSGEVEIDGINYELNGETKQATVIAKTSDKYSGEVIIPESVEHEGTAYSVTSIGNEAFYECSGLTSVTIGNSVTSIGYAAFSDCSGLTSVSIGNSVTSIGGYAFYKCSGLTSVTIPNSVTSIGEGAFYECTGLTSVTIPNSVTSIGEKAFYKCSGLTSVSIGNSVTSIGGYAFYKCSGLTSVTIPNSVTSIGSSAFYECSGLTSVTIPNSVTSIGLDAFSSCSGLTSVTIGSSVESIEGSAFAYCSKLSDVYCYAEEVPATSSYAFGIESSSIASATLHVRAASINSYSTTEPWNGFANIVALPIQYELSVSSAGYATLCLAYNAEIPQDVEVYVAEKVDGDCLKMKKVEGVLPAMTGVIVKANEGTYAFIQSEDTPAEIGENLLVGSVFNKMITAEDNTSYYILAAPDDNNNEMGMYRVELIDDMFECMANKAYLPLESSAPARISFDFGTETGIRELKDENDNVKTEIYDLSGRKVENAKKGIFIVNGKKVVK